MAPQRTLGLDAAEMGAKGSGAPFGVVFGGPVGQTSDASEVTVVWNRPMRRLELAGEEKMLDGAVSPVRLTSPSGAPKGSWRWLGTSAIVFAPDKALPRATEFNVTVPAGTRALGGETLAKDHSFAFQTSLPRLVRVTPGDGATHLEPKQTFELRFNQPVDPKEVQRATSVSNGKAKLAFTVSQPDPQIPTLMKLTPSKPLPLDAKIAIATDATLRGVEGPLPSGEAHTTNVETYGPLTVHTLDCSRTAKKLCVPHGGVHLELANRVTYKELLAHVRTEPASALRWPKGRASDDKVEYASLPIELRAASTTRVIVTAGMKDEYGQTLARDFVATLAADDEAPSVAIGLQGEILEAAKAKGRQVQVASVNVDRYELVSAAATEVGLLKVLSARDARTGYDAAKALPGAKVDDVRPGGARNATALRTVGIDDVLAGAKGRGAFVLATSRPGVGQARPYVDRQIVSVTDIGITAKVSRFGSLVFVTRLSTGKPIAGATVALRNREGAELLTMPTDASGFAVLPPDRFQPVRTDGTLDRDLFVFARVGDDWSYRQVDDRISRAEAPYIDLAARMPVFGLLFADRGIYKTGETIHVKGVFRKHEPNGLLTPRGREVTLHALDAQGTSILDHKAKLGPFGEVTVDIPLPTTTRLGHVQIEARFEDAKKNDDDWSAPAATTSVEVAAYRPAEFKVAVEPDHPAYVRGDKATFTAHGDYLFGAPMSGGSVRFTATRSRTFFQPPGADELVLDDSTYSAALPDASPRGGKIAGGNGALDARGAYLANVNLTLPKQEGTESVRFEAEIEDLSRQTVASEASAIVHPAEFYVALGRPKNLFEAANTSLPVVVSAIEPSGKRRAGEKVTVELVRRTWQTSTEASGEWDLHYESRPVDAVVATCTAVTVADGAASCTVKPAEAGYFIVRARSTDRRGNPVAASYGVYVDGESERVAWPVFDGPRLELVTNKKSYEIGDVAKILVKSPFKEAEALVTIERQGIHDKRRIPVKGSMPTIDVPITKEMWPNTFVSVELVSGRSAPVSAKGQDPGAPAYRIGWAEIAVNPEARRLKVAVVPSRKDFKPGDDVDVDVTVTDRAGKGARADVAFYAVDEGVLMLTGYTTPDPLATFAARRNLSVAPIESRDDLARIVRLGRGPGEDKGDEGGGGGEGGIRQDFRSTAFFQPSVVTGADGKAHVRFKLPDSLTTYRLMAVAEAEDDRFGFGQDQVVTSRPLMARPALPRFLRAGDTIEAGVILTSKGLPGGTVDVRLDVKGLESRDATKRVTLPANGSVEVKWTIAAPKAGQAEFAFKASMGGATDSVTVKREVAVPMSLEAVALYGETEHAIAEQLGDMRAIRSDVGGLDLRVASTALVGLDSGVDALVEYPYGCAEQLTSKMVPLVALGDLARDYGIKLGASPSGRPGAASAATPEALADDAIAKILKTQRDDGGFAYWADAPRADTWLTAYVLWGLSLAKERGRPVPSIVIESATRWLRDRIAECSLEPGGPPKKARPVGRLECANDDVGLATRAFIVDVLAMIGKPDAGYATRLFEQRAKMPLFARALLAHAMVVSKMRPEDARELVRDAEAHVRVTTGGAMIVENVGDKYAAILDSDARTTAIVLRTLVAVEPKHPLAARLAKGLLAARRGGAWRTTQENAWALLSLDTYRKAQEATAPDFDAGVFFGDKEVMVAPMHERTVKGKTASFPASDLFGKAGQNLAFEVRGKGKLFYEARLRYAKKELPVDTLDRGFFVRKLVRSVKPEALAEAMRTIPPSSASSATASDLVLVDLLVVTADPREQVVIDDPLPAGLEPVQSKLATTARDLAVDERGDEGDEADADARSDDMVANGQAYQSSWYHREFHDDRVLTFVDHMAAGMYHYRYLARATTPGKFVVPPTRAECMYEPETFGRTGAVSFEVKAK